MTIHTAAPGGNMSQQNLAPFGMWSSVQTYNIGDMIVSSSAAWRSLVNSNRGNNPAETAFWTKEIGGGGGGGLTSTGAVTGLDGTANQIVVTTSIGNVVASLSPTLITPGNLRVGGDLNLPSTTGAPFSINRVLYISNTTGVVNASPGLTYDPSGSPTAILQVGSTTGLTFGTLVVVVDGKKATTGSIRMGANAQINGRDAADSSNLSMIGNSVGSGGEEFFVGNDVYPARIKTNLAVPTSLSDGDWWAQIVVTGTSRQATINVRDGGVTYSQNIGAAH